MKRSLMMRLDELRAGTLGGTICSVWASVNWGDLIQTVLLAVVGSLVSFGLSALMRRWRGKD